jgi:hypothetical protein
LNSSWLARCRPTRVATRSQSTPVERFDPRTAAGLFAIGPVARFGMREGSCCKLTMRRVEKGPP